ncbi:hypothetical protein DPMN_011058 [Dreissena polymorpha]|uniref:Uncharacterized protein n=1 Tax=Dreissena polymorpha TaxID=45954 RepID=A0A9D4N110_DREPO|nr:hypothetical protein DPMN_011058 [Dreissena polymorpha]
MDGQDLTFANCDGNSQLLCVSVQRPERCAIFVQPNIRLNVKAVDRLGAGASSRSIPHRRLL